MAGYDEQANATRGEYEASIASQQLAEQQALDRNIATLDSEGGEINPYYDTLLRGFDQTYEDTLRKTRESAATRGVYRSGILTNQELKMGSQYTSQKGDYNAERTRKLSDITRRRTMSITQAEDNKKNIFQTGQAGLAKALADLRANWEAQQASLAASRSGGYGGGGGGAAAPNDFYLSALDEFEGLGNDWNEVGARERIFENYAVRAGLKRDSAQWHEWMKRMYQDTARTEGSRNKRTQNVLKDYTSGGTKMVFDRATGRYRARK